ncbi:MAG: hypothetical protein KGI98_17735 [Euryarchaeota archaeon]|nr:hypothetical protein [Euryarchaeota archaeon]
MKNLKVTGSTFTSPDPESQRISGTRSASGKSRGSRNLESGVRAQRTLTTGSGQVLTPDLALATRNRK